MASQSSLQISSGDCNGARSIASRIACEREKVWAKAARRVSNGSRGASARCSAHHVPGQEQVKLPASSTTRKEDR